MIYNGRYCCSCNPKLLFTRYTQKHKHQPTNTEPQTTQANNMKLAALSLFALTAADLAWADNAALCAAKNAGLMTAIQTFCGGKTNMVVPSDYTAEYAGAWAWSPDHHTQIFINALTYKDQPVWVPQKYCFSQLYEICATGNDHGGHTKSYGTKGCQALTIHYYRFVHKGTGVGPGSRKVRRELLAAADNATMSD